MRYYIFKLVLYSLFGEIILNTEKITELINLEKDKGKDSIFTELDNLIFKILTKSLNSIQVTSIIKKEHEIDTFELIELSSTDKTLINDLFNLENQQKNGAWYFPEKIKLNTGIFSLPYFMNTHGKLGSGIAFEESSTYQFKSSPQIIFIWSLLEPLFSELYSPVNLRGQLSSNYDKEKQKKLWTETEQFLKIFNLDTLTEFTIMKPGNGWSKLNSLEQYNTKLNYLKQVKNKFPDQSAKLNRLYNIKSLTDQYFKKKGKDDSVLASKVLAKNFQGFLSAYFQGSWLNFLNYIDETPHPQEKVITSLPEININLPSKTKIENISEQFNVSKSETELILASMWGTNENISPIHSRIKVIKNFWAVFDSIHSIQKVGMESLWGIEYQEYLEDKDANNSERHPNSMLFLKKYPFELLSDIEKYWGKKILGKHPEIIVSEPYPLVSLINVLNTAFRFWHECGLTAWFICMGPSSRTELNNMENFYSKYLNELKNLGAPINSNMFRELIESENTKLGKPKEIILNQKELGHGSTSYTTVTQRSGFEYLRDIITKYRREWQEKYLHDYLKLRFESDFKSIAEKYYIFCNKNNKSPTAKQFSAFSSKIVNDWFGGDLNGLYSVLQEKSPIKQNINKLIPDNKSEFENYLYKKFSKIALKDRSYSGALLRINRFAYVYLQLFEALGRKPTISEYSKTKFHYQVAFYLDENIETAWEKFTKVIDEYLKIN